jgi:HPt (histidine-containing phosphotransfer) domain-containing protein
VNGPESLRAIEAALGEADYGTIRKLAHALKGAATNLRATAVGTVAAQLELAAESGQNAEIPAQVRKLQCEIKRTIAYLQSKVS